MPMSKNRGKIFVQPLTSNQASPGRKELPMKSNHRSRNLIIASCAAVMLVLTGMRCQQSMPSQPSPVPTYTEKTVLGKVSWPLTSSIDQTALDAIPAAEREKIKLSGVPVLVPKDPRFLKVTEIFQPDERGYNFGSKEWVDGISFDIFGGRVAGMSDAPVPPQLYEDDPNDVMINGFSVSFSQNENDNWSATWGGYGEVGYLISLHCQERTDPRCLDTTYFTQLIKSLVFVGGNFTPYETEIQK